MDAPDQPGTLVASKYRLERPLARGASAIVWEATHTLTGRTVALKLCDPRNGWGPKQQERWLREARAASRVSHPNLLPIEDVLALEDGRAALVMERLVGRSLRARIEEGPLPPDEVIRLFLPVIEALAQAHAAGVVHRDLKPDNLFLTSSPERLVILDFGVAKLNSDAELGLTSTGATVGTPFYMAPEQLFGEDDVDARADVWALGVVLQECLAGRRPTEAANLGQLLKKISADNLQRLSPEDLPEHPALVELLQRMLDTDRDTRASLAEVQALLGEPGQRTLPAAAPAVLRATPSQSTPPSEEITAASAPSWRPRMLLGAALGTVVLIAGLLFYQPPPSPPSQGAPPRNTTAAKEPGSPSVSASSPEPIPAPPFPETKIRAPAPAASPPALRPAIVQPSPGRSAASAPAKPAPTEPPPPADAPPRPPRIVEQPPF